MEHRIRRNDATHPRVLPDPADEVAHFKCRRGDDVWVATEARAEEIDAVLERQQREVTDPADEAAYLAHRAAEQADIQRLLQPIGTWTEGDPCALCHEPEEPEDPIAHFVAPDNSTYVMAHGQCGLDAGLRLA